jgi:ferredoxin
VAHHTVRSGYERASEVIESATHRGVGMCYCRHKAQHMDRECDAPMDICMTFNNTASSLIRHGFAREIDTAECFDLLQPAQDENLVQFGENVQQRVNFICNCCGCCCEAKLDEQVCLGCGVCVHNCSRDAIHLEPRDQRVITPINSAHRTVLMAVERGKLQELIFDNQAMASHRAMAAILGVILELPAVKQTLAKRQMRSRYLDRLLRISH